MNRYIRKYWNTDDIPTEAKVLTTVTSIRWIGWGFAESLIPVFLYSFGHTFAQAGLLRSSYDIAYILALPLVGVLADRMRATSLVLIGIVGYLFVGTAYLFAGLTGFAIYIVIARVANGVSYAFEGVGRSTCIRRHTPQSMLATVFGYIDTVGDFWWIAASVAGIFLVKYFSISSLLFLISPTALIAAIVLIRYRKKKTERIGEPKPKNVPLKSILKEITFWNSNLKSLLLFNFFFYFTSAVIAFFLPIQAFISGDGYTSVILMGIVVVLPTLLGWKLGKLFDGKGSKIFNQSLFLFAFLIFSLVFWQKYVWQLIVLFTVSLIAELLYLGTNEMITANSAPEHLGRIDGIMRSVADIGSMMGPLVIGVVMDSYGIPVAYSVLGTIILALALMFYFTNSKSKTPVIAQDPVEER